MQRESQATNAMLMARRQAAIPRGVGHSHQIFIAKGENAEIWDVEGRRYIDFAGGIAVLNTGHRNPAVIEAVKDQLDQYTHTCFQVLAYEPYVELAERLNAKAPGDFAKKTLFLTTGAEAVENAIKVARIATGRNAVIAFGGAFHGRTFMGMTLTGKVEPYKKGFGAMMPDVFHVPFPQEVHNISTADAMAGLTKLFKADIELRDNCNNTLWGLSVGKLFHHKIGDLEDWNASLVELVKQILVAI